MRSVFSSVLEVGTRAAQQGGRGKTNKHENFISSAMQLARTIEPVRLSAPNKVAKKVFSCPLTGCHWERRTETLLESTCLSAGIDAFNANTVDNNVPLVLWTGDTHNSNFGLSRKNGIIVHSVNEAGEVTHLRPQLWPTHLRCGARRRHN